MDASSKHCCLMVTAGCFYYVITDAEQIQKLMPVDQSEVISFHTFTSSILC